SVDHALWGMNAAGDRGTNIVLRGAAAVLVCLMARRLLALGLAAASPRAIALGACVAALFFAVHPLRVESVAWVTERRDELSGLFYLLTVLTYLKACDAADAWRTRWRGVSVGVYALGLLSKSMVMSLPLALLVLDVYPLRRARGAWRQILLEKLPYLVLAVAAAVVSVLAVSRLGLTSASAYPPPARIAMALYSLVFYVWK